MQDVRITWRIGFYIPLAEEKCWELYEASSFLGSKNKNRRLLPSTKLLYNGVKARKIDEESGAQ